MATVFFSLSFALLPPFDGPCCLWGVGLGGGDSLEGAGGLVLVKFTAFIS